MQSHHRLLFAAAALLLGVVSLPSPLGAQCEPLTLRVSDAEAVPGGTAAVVLRTYSARPVGQGQVDLRASVRAPLNAGTDLVPTLAGRVVVASPFVSFDGAVVFSSQDDATIDTTFDPAAQSTVLDMLSASASINDQDGPLAVLYFTVDPALSPGQEFDLELDLSSFLDGPGGVPIVLDHRPGVLTIRSPLAPRTLEADGVTLHPGLVAQVAISTLEPFPIDAGVIALRYDPAVAAGPPVVSMDPRHGAASFSVETPEPGLVVIEVSSPGGTSNGVPGDLILVGLPTLRSVAPGTSSPLTLDAALTHLDHSGAPYSLSLLGDVIDFSVQPVVFYDNFECGSTVRWTATSP